VSYASPSLTTLAGVRQIVSVNESNVTGHDPASGNILWEAPWKGNSSADASASQPLTPGDDFVLLSKGYNAGSKLLKIVDKDGQLAAELEWDDSTILKTKFTNAAIIDGYIYALSDGILECIELKTGETMWKGKRRRQGDYGQGQVLAVGDVILVQAEEGEVVMVDATSKELVELGRFPALTGQTWNNLCLYGKYLLVRNSEEAACFELALEELPPSVKPAAPNDD
jgi:outer membrane protein assembly factor BamB